MVGVDAVVIGRNEGARLLACLASLRGQVRRLVYVDSGSTDGSVEAARATGASVVVLDLATPFTAARARNAGLALLGDDPPEFVQMVDGDCVVDPGWIAAALTGFAAHPGAVVVCGRRRERFPGRSVYNALADREWDTPVGPAQACGGDAMMRYVAVQAVGCYRADLIAGEEPELCLRLRVAGGEIWRLDAEMTLHDAAMTRFSQWWRRTVRAGHAYAEGARLHRAAGHWVRETRRCLIWGFGLPVVILAAVAVTPWSGLLALLYPAQVVRLAPRLGWVGAGYAVLGKFAEAQGAAGFYLAALRGARRRIIEYR